MRAELMVLGKHFDMTRQEDRRKLVITIYAVLAVAMAALGWLDAWRGSGYYLVILALMMNHFLLGGYGRRGLVRPFDGKAPREAVMPSPMIPLGLYLRVTSSLPEGDWRSDERETVLRGSAHYQAYQWMSAAMGALWLLSGWATAKSRTFPVLHTAAEMLLYPVVLASVILMLTLPQAILLWTEPDMGGFDTEN
jgi:hypothetical protein